MVMNIKRLAALAISHKPATERAFSILAWLAENKIPWSASQAHGITGEYSESVVVTIGTADDGVTGRDVMFTMAVIYAAGAFIRRYSPATTPPDAN